MMILLSPEVKHFIFDLLTFEDGVDEKGQKIQRKIFKRDLLKAYKNLKEKLLESVEIGLAPKDADLATFKFEDLVWVGIEESKTASAENMKMLTERWTNRELELTDSDCKIIKHFYLDREFVSELSLPSLAEFEQIVA